MVLGSASKKQTLIYQDIYEEIWTKLKATPSYQQTQEESILFSFEIPKIMNMKRLPNCEYQNSFLFVFFWMHQYVEKEPLNFTMESANSSNSFQFLFFQIHKKITMLQSSRCFSYHSL